MTQRIFHITTETAAKSAAEIGSYQHQSLIAEGFIHCSTIDQLLLPANERYRGQRDLVVLEILVVVLQSHDPPVPLVFEDSYGTGIEFPHLYGPLPWSAVGEVIPFPCRPDGRFELPHDLRTG